MLLMSDHKAALSPPPRTLIIGYGNPGRQDDGLGPAFVSRLIRQQDLPVWLTTASAYQLEVELAETLLSCDRVVFVDATLEAGAPFSFRRIQADASGEGFGSHSLSPGALLALCAVIYGHQPEGYVLAIQGIEFDLFEEQLSSDAQNNLKEASEFFLNWLEGGYTELTAR